MQVALDSYDRVTAYADLREGESLTANVRARAMQRARQLGAEYVEFWRPPYGSGADRMEGFIELARVSSLDVSALIADSEGLVQPVEVQ